MTTELTYWNKQGKYQKVYDKIWKDFIPSTGEAKIHHAEAVRCISRIYYDFFNNGFCNAIEDCEWTDYYEDMIYYVYEYLEYATLDTIESNAILKGSRNDSKIEAQLEKLTDEVLQKAKRWLDGLYKNRYLLVNLYEEIEKILNETGAHERLQELTEKWGLDNYEELGVDFESAIWECIQDRIHKR